MNSDKKTHYAVLINGHETITNGVYLKKQEDNGGAKRDRTADLLRARQALSQLSYGPVQTCHLDNWWVWADSNCRPHPYQGCALTN